MCNSSNTLTSNSCSITWIIVKILWSVHFKLLNTWIILGNNFIAIWVNKCLRVIVFPKNQIISFFLQYDVVRGNIFNFCGPIKWSIYLYNKWNVQNDKRLFSNTFICLNKVRIVFKLPTILKAMQVFLVTFI